MLCTTHKDWNDTVSEFDLARFFILRLKKCFLMRADECGGVLHDVAVGVGTAEIECPAECSSRDQKDLPVGFDRPV